MGPPLAPKTSNIQKKPCRHSVEFLAKKTKSEAGDEPADNKTPFLHRFNIERETRRVKALELARRILAKEPAAAALPKHGKKPVLGSPFFGWSNKDIETYPRIKARALLDRTGQLKTANDKTQFRSRETVLTLQRDVAAKARNVSTRFPFFCSPAYDDELCWWKCTKCQNTAASVCDLIDPDRQKGSCRAYTGPSISRASRKEKAEEFGLTQHRRRVHISDPDSVARRINLADDVEAGVSYNVNRLADWKCPHPGCDFNLPVGTKNADLGKKNHLRLHGITDPVKYKQGSHPLHAEISKRAKYRAAKRKVESFNSVAPAWAHNLELLCSEEDALKGNMPYLGTRYVVGVQLTDIEMAPYLKKEGGSGGTYGARCTLCGFHRPSPLKILQVKPFCDKRVEFVPEGIDIKEYWREPQKGLDRAKCRGPVRNRTKTVFTDTFITRPNDPRFEHHRAEVIQLFKDTCYGIHTAIRKKSKARYAQRCGLGTQPIAPLAPAGASSSGTLY